MGDICRKPSLSLAAEKRRVGDELSGRLSYLSWLPSPQPYRITWQIVGSGISSLLGIKYLKGKWDQHKYKTSVFVLFCF